MEGNNKKKETAKILENGCFWGGEVGRVRRMLFFGNKSQEIMWISKLCKSLILMKI